MRKKKHILHFALYAAVFISCIFPVSAAVIADSNNSTFSFWFENCTVTDALTEISRKSGISIIVNSIIEKEILSKSYINRDLDSIINDLLRGENCAVIWNYNNGNLESIGLYTFGRSGLKINLADTGNLKKSTVIDESNSSPEDKDKKALKTNSLENNKNVSRSSSNLSKNVPNLISSDNPSSKKINSRANSAFRTSSISRNIQRKSIIKQNNQEDKDGDDVIVRSLPDSQNSETIEPDSPEPVPSESVKYIGLEPPPMPPGL